ncbi:MAG: aldo/keto reductase [Candidatus Hydrogenedentota bacterium]
MRRRDFLGTMAATTTWLAAGGAWPGVAEEQKQLDELGPMPRRPLGDSGIDLPVMGFGGLVARDNTPEAVDRVVGLSLDLGIDFFDTAASYGNSEEMLAPVIGPRRDKLILATKTRERTREGARREFARSCEILGTGHFDLYLVHGIQHVERDVEAAFAQDGAMPFLREKKKAGEIRLLGFSAHSTEAALRAMDLYDFDFFYFPVNYVAWFAGDFGPAVLDVAKAKGIPCVSLKALARQHWPAGTPKEDRCKGCWYQPIESPEEASLALRWSLSQGVASALPPGNEGLYRKALTLASDLQPITPEETAKLSALAQDQNPLFPR